VCLHVEEWNFVRQRKMDLCVRQRKWNCLQDGERMDLCVSRREDLCVLGVGVETDGALRETYQMW
jgi:hypothetical protein